MKVNDIQLAVMNRLLKQYQQKPETNDEYFNRLISDSLKLLSKDKPCYVFNLDHIVEIEKVFKTIIVVEVEPGIFKVRRTTNVKVKTQTTKRNKSNNKAK